VYNIVTGPKVIEEGMAAGMELIYYLAADGFNIKPPVFNLHIRLPGEYDGAETALVEGSFPEVWLQTFLWLRNYIKDRVKVDFDGLDTAEGGHRRNHRRSHRPCRPSSNEGQHHGYPRLRPQGGGRRRAQGRDFGNHSVSEKSTGYNGGDSGCALDSAVFFEKIKHKSLILRCAPRMAHGGCQWGKKILNMVYKNNSKIKW
jgi:hypothetical protein